MPKYLLQASYTTEGVKGLLKNGGSKRREVVEQLTKALGGRVEAFYFAFGDDDVYIISDVPDHVTMSAVSLTVNASGAVKVKTTVLLTAEEVDQATKMTVNYRAPGQGAVPDAG
jgi:uncharacterized protein with GYD domain